MFFYFFYTCSFDFQSHCHLRHCNRAVNVSKVTHFFYTIDRVLDQYRSGYISLAIQNKGTKMWLALCCWSQVPIGWVNPESGCVVWKTIPPEMDSNPWHTAFEASALTTLPPGLCDMIFWVYILLLFVIIL